MGKNYSKYLSHLPEKNQLAVPIFKIYIYTYHIYIIFDLVAVQTSGPAASAWWTGDCAAS